MSFVTAAVVITCIVCAVLASNLGEDKGRGPEGAVYGLLFGPLGVLLIAVLEPRYPRACPDCLSGVPLLAKRCRCCGYYLVLATDVPALDVAAAPAVEAVAIAAPTVAVVPPLPKRKRTIAEALGSKH